MVIISYMCVSPVYQEVHYVSILIFKGFLQSEFKAHKRLRATERQGIRVQKAVLSGHIVYGKL